MMDLFVKIFTAALLVEAIWETIRTIVEAAANKKEFLGKMASLVIGIIVAINYDLDLPKLSGLQNHYHIVGVVITGILISRGSQFTHDIVKNLENNNFLAKENHVLEVHNKGLNNINNELLEKHEQIKKLF